MSWLTVSTTHISIRICICARSSGDPEALVHAFQIGVGKGHVPGRVLGLEDAAVSLTNKPCLPWAYVVMAGGTKTKKQVDKWVLVFLMVTNVRAGKGGWCGVIRETFMRFLSGKWNQGHAQETKEQASRWVARRPEHQRGSPALSWVQHFASYLNFLVLGLLFCQIEVKILMMNLCVILRIRYDAHVHKCCWPSHPGSTLLDPLPLTLRGPKLVWFTVANESIKSWALDGSPKSSLSTIHKLWPYFPDGRCPHVTSPHWCPICYPLYVLLLTLSSMPTP